MLVCFVSHWLLALYWCAFAAAMKMQDFICLQVWTVHSHLKPSMTLNSSQFLCLACIVEGQGLGVSDATFVQGISGLDGAQTILDLTNSIPDIISDLLGYSVVPQQLQQNQLEAGEMFNTTNVVKPGSGVNGVPAYIPIEIKTTNTMTQVSQLLVALTAQGAVGQIQV